MVKITLNGKATMMRDIFRCYFPLGKEQIDNIWKNSLIVFDTNVLLEIYRLSEESRNTFFKIISANNISERLWLPYQVGKEFFLKRAQVILEQTTIADKLNSKLLNHKNKLIEDISKIPMRNEHPFININEVKNIISEKFSEIEIYIKNKLKSHPNHLHEDMFLEKIEKVFLENIGEKLSEKTLNDHKKEANGKYEKNTGVGCKDKDKDGDEKYGDYFIWKEMIFKSKKECRPIIFVTNEEKDDYWLKSDGKKIGMRYEHREEFFNETGQEILIYSLNIFLEKANNDPSKDPTPSVGKLINEIEKISNFKKSLDADEKNYKNFEKFRKEFLEKNNFNKSLLEHQRFLESFDKFKFNKIDDFLKKMMINFYSMEYGKNYKSSENSINSIKNESLIHEESEDDNDS